MQWTDQVQIETPEQIDVALETAGLGSRFVAWTTDWVFKLLILGLLMVVTIIALSLMGMALSKEDRELAMLPIAMLVALSYASVLGYDIYFEVNHNGQTPGKKQAGIRVIRDGGAPVTFPSSCIRNFLAIADFMPMFYVLGGLLVLLSKRHQRLGDLAAGTLVVRERVLDIPTDIGKVMESLASPDFVFTATQVAACPPRSRTILRSFFQRYREMDQAPRQQLARRLAEDLAGHMAYVPAIPLRAAGQAEAFLATLYRNMESLQRHGR